MKIDYQSQTFRKVELTAGIERDDQSWESWINEGSVPAWYRSVYDTPFGEFSEFDLCRSLRQDLYPNQIIPVAIDRCIEDPAVGDLLECEVAINVIKASERSNFFQAHPDELKRFLSIIPDAIAATNYSEDQDVLHSFWVKYQTG